MSAVPGVGGMIGQIPLPAKLDRAGMAGGRRHGFQDHPPPRPRPQWRGGGAIGLAGVIDRGRTDTVRTGIVAGVEHVIDALALHDPRRPEDPPHPLYHPFRPPTTATPPVRNA